MQAGRRLVEDVERAAGGPPRQFLGELHALRLAARQGRRLLADMDVAEADLLQGQELVADHRHGLEELDALVDRHLQHVGDRLAAEVDFQRLAVVALALADVALDVDVGQEVHLDLDDAVALAGLAAPALDVEREAAGLVAALGRFRQLGEPVADRREGAGVGRRVGARRAADRRLVDVDDLVEMAHAVEPAVLAGMLARAVQPARQGLVERLDDQGALAAARDAGDAGEGAERDAGRHVLQVVLARALHGQPAAALGRRLAALLGNGHLAKAREVLAGEAGAVGHDLLGRALGDDPAAMRPGARPHVDQMVGGADRVLVVLDHQHRVAEVAQAGQRLQQPVVVALVQADRRLVEHVEHAGQARADLRGEPDALALAARQGARGAVQRQVGRGPRCRGSPAAR